MARHHPDLIMCRKQPGIAVGRLCEKCEWCRAQHAVLLCAYRCCVARCLGRCFNKDSRPPCAARPAMLCTLPQPHRHHPPAAGDGKCPICDSYVRPATLVRVCDECNYGSYAVRLF